MSLQNPDNIVTEERLAEFYQQILPYLGGMPDVLANKFNRSDLYSTDEKIIGRWIDGKPLYQKTIDFGALPNAKTKEIEHNISDVDIVTYVCGVSYDSTRVAQIHLPNAVNTSNYIGVNAGRTTVSVNTGSNRTSFTETYITIQYTKTTDSAVEIGDDTDYSTTEKIVGTWIDGKPIWQKTYHDVYTGSFSTGTSVIIDSALTMSNIRLLNSVITNNANNNSVNDVNSNSIYVRLTASALTVMGNVSYGNVSNMDVTIQYTKTSS